LEIAEAYLKVARVQGVPINANLGQMTEARESLVKADAVVESVLAGPGLVPSRRALLPSAGIARDSLILAPSHNGKQARVVGRKAEERLEALARAPGYSPQDAAAAAALYVNIALGHSNMHQVEQGARYARRAVEILRTHDGDQHQLGRAFGVLANTARFSG